MHLLHLNDDVLTEIIGLLRTADRASLLQTSRILHILVTPHFPDTVVLSKSPRHTANFFTYIFSNVKDRAPPIRRFELERSGFVEDSVESDAEVHAFLVTPLLIELLAHTRSLDTLVISSLHELERSKRGLCRAIALLPSLRTAAFHDTEWTGLLSRQMHLALSSIEVSPIRNVIASTSQGLDALGAIRRLSASLESLELRFSPPTDNYPQEPPALFALIGDSWPRVRQLIMDAAESSPRYIDVEWLSQAFPTVEHLTVEGHAPGTTLIPASHVSGASWRSLRSVHGDVASMSHIPLSVNVHSLRLWPSTRGPLAHNLHRDDALLFNILSQTSGTRFLHLKGGRWGFPSRAIWSSIASMQTLIYLQIEMRYRSNPPLDSMVRPFPCLFSLG